MGKIDSDCRDERDIIIDLRRQMDVYNSNDVQKLIEAYVQRGFIKFILNLEQVTYWTAPPPVILSLVSEV